MSLPVPQPAYILRGHASQIHSTTFIRNNSRLVTGDADGWVVVWSLVSKRAVAVWRAHEGTILGVESWGDGRLITHGKDNKLVVWKFGVEDEEGLSTALPVDEGAGERKQPWLLYALDVNTMNFCSFAACGVKDQVDLQEEGLFIAVPNILSSETVDIFELPSSKRIHTLPKPPSSTVATGMVMALSIFYHCTNLVVVAGYESGHTAVAEQFPDGSWHYTYASHPHSQPILSLSVSSSYDFYFTSSADAVIAKHPIPHTIHPSQTHIQTPAPQTSPPQRFGDTSKPYPSLLSQAFANSSPQSHPSTPCPPLKLQTTPMNVVQTGHAGQQGLRVRDDGRIFATAGWDSRARVYSVKTMKEKAVLKWHKEGCFSVAFAKVKEEGLEDEGRMKESSEGQEKSLVPRLMGLSVGEQRRRKAELTHWVAVGSKDGKVSLWEIY